MSRSIISPELGAANARKLEETYPRILHFDIETSPMC